MSRPRKIDKKERWYLPKSHPFFNLGYCYQRVDKAYTFIIPAYRETTPFLWSNSHKKYALDLLIYRINALNNPTELGIVTLTMSQLIQKYEDLHFPNFSAANRKKHMEAFNHYFSKDLPLESNSIRDHLNKMIVESDLSNNTQNRLLMFANRVLQFGVDEGYLDRNPLLRAMVPKYSKPEQKKISDEEVRKLIRHFYKKDDREMMYLLLLLRTTGMRINEAITLKWSDVSDKKIIIRGKGRRNRQFPLDLFPEVRLILAKIKKFGNKVTVFRWITTKTPQQLMRNAMSSLKIHENGKLFHSIRKLRENELIYNKRYDSNIVAQILGHTPAIQAAHYEEELSAERITEILRDR